MQSLLAYSEQQARLHSEERRARERMEEEQALQLAIAQAESEQEAQARAAKQVRVFLICLILHQCLLFLLQSIFVTSCCVGPSFCLHKLPVNSIC